MQSEELRLSCIEAAAAEDVEKLMTALSSFEK